MSFSSNEIQQQWTKVRARLQADLGDVVYHSWIKPLNVIGYENGEIKISAPTRFIKDWIEIHYLDRLKNFWHRENSAVRSLTFVINKESINKTFSTSENYQQSVEEKELLNKNNQLGSETSFLTELGTSFDPKFTFENFITDKSNELAHVAARRIADSTQVTYNPLFLYSGVGLGKTHLMHAIGLRIKQQFPGKKVVYLSAERFMYQFVRALRRKDMVGFKDQFRSVDVLMIDDIQFISGKDSTQEEFFHTFNALIDKNHQIVVSADKPPMSLEGLNERVRSRLAGGLVVDISPTTYELRLGILKSKANLLKVNIPLEVLEFLAHKITSNVRELEGVLNRIVAHAALINKNTITLQTAQEVLHDLLAVYDRPLSIEQIQKRVAEHFNIKMSDMYSERRARVVARPRQIAMYLAKQLTNRSLPEIGRCFGDRDHTTVMHAVKKIEELQTTDKFFGQDVQYLRQILQG
ncbi:MAG: chromosomal replication initiator protein DnaA [Alphaproteobacteria bacterium]|nr:chromosomal replication initiator protein DnaA [Alphaproteobacteria bacterium]